VAPASSRPIVAAPSQVSILAVFDQSNTLLSRDVGCSLARHLDVAVDQL
jgi:hypothetical protein